jgi:hypothetical protein
VSTTTEEVRELLKKIKEGATSVERKKAVAKLLDIADQGGRSMIPRDNVEAVNTACTIVCAVAMVFTEVGEEDALATLTEILSMAYSVLNMEIGKNE